MVSQGTKRAAFEGTTYNPCLVYYDDIPRFTSCNIPRLSSGHDSICINLLITEALCKAALYYTMRVSNRRD